MITSGAIQGISLIIFKALWETKDEAYKLFSQRLSHAIFYASEQYKENFILRHGFIRQEEFRPSVSLEDIYVKPYFIDQSGLLGRTNKAMLPHEEIDYLANLNLVCDGFDLSDKHPNLIVKGEQGIGKTTFLKKIGLAALSGQNFANTAKRYIPVFIQISQQLKKDFDLKTMIEQEFKTCGFPEYDEFVESALKKGRFLILIDELDAAPLDLQDKLLLKIKDFADSYGLNRFIITCRTFKKTHNLSRFYEALILGFDAQKAQQYIQKSLESESSSLVNSETVWNHLRGNSKTTKYIIHNPFSLSIALSLYQHREHLILGQTFLYDKIVSKLIVADSSPDLLSDGVQNLDNSSALRLKVLSEMAYICLQSGKQKFHKMEVYRLYTAILEKYSIPQNLPSIDHFKEERLFYFITVSDSDLCQFKNPMIQKILVAHYLMENLEDQDEVIERYFNDSNWKDVFVFLSGMQGSDYLIDAIKPQISRHFCTQRLSSFIILIDSLSEKVILSHDKAINRCYVAFIIFDIIFLFRNRRYDQDLLSKILKKNRNIIDLLEPESQFLLPSRSNPGYQPKLNNKYLMDPKIIRGLSIEKIFDLALALSKRVREYGLMEPQEFKLFFSIVTRIKKQVKTKSMSSYHRKICERNLYRLWLKVLKIDDQDLDFTMDELQTIFLYYQNICLIFCCTKEAFYISGRVSQEVGELIFNPRLMADCQFIKT